MERKKAIVKTHKGDSLDLDKLQEAIKACPVTAIEYSEDF